MKWPTAKLAECCTKIGSGSTPRGGDSVYQDEGIALIRSQNIYNGLFTTDGLAFIGDEHADELAGVTVEQGDVLLNITGDSVARCCQVPESALPARVNQHVAIVRPKPEQFDARYLLYFLISPPMQSYMLSRAGTGGTRNALTKEMIQHFEIPKPPLDEQRRIAEVLTAYDELMENNRRRMALLEEAARQLYAEWFVRLRYPGHARTRRADTLPKGWTRRPLGEVADVNRETLGSSFQGELEYVDISAVTPGRIAETTRYDFADAPSRARRVVRHGDIIWSCVRPNRRSHAVIWNPEPNLIVSTGFAVLTPKTLPTSYLYEATTTDAFVRNLENRARGAAYPAVVARDFEESEIRVPPAPLVSAFNDFAEPLLAQLKTLTFQTQKLRTARDLLLPRLMSGEIAV